MGDLQEVGDEVAPAFAVVFGVVACRGVEQLTRSIPVSSLRAWVRLVGVSLLGAFLLWPAWVSVYGPRAQAWVVI